MINREVLIVTSTKDKYRNHTESLKDAKIFAEPEVNLLTVFINSTMQLQLQTGLLEEFLK